MGDLSPPRRPARATSILHDTGHHVKSPLAPAPSQGSYQRCCTSLSMKLLEKATSVPAQTAIHNEPPAVGCRSSCKPTIDMRGTSRRSTRTAANPPSLAQRRSPRRRPARNHCPLASDSTTEHHPSNSKNGSSHPAATNVTA